MGWVEGNKYDGTNDTERIEADSSRIAWKKAGIHSAALFVAR